MRLSLRKPPAGWSNFRDQCANLEKVESSDVSIRRDQSILKTANGYCQWSSLRSSSTTLFVFLARATGAIVVTGNARRSLRSFHGLCPAENSLNIADVFPLIGLDSDDNLNPVQIAKIQEFGVLSPRLLPAQRRTPTVREVWLMGAPVQERAILIESWFRARCLLMYSPPGMIDPLSFKGPVCRSRDHPVVWMDE